MGVWVGTAVHSVTEALMGPLDLLPPIFALLVVTVLTGAVALFVVKVTTNQHSLVRSRQQMASAIYEMRLFLDAPQRVLRAQLRLVYWSFAYTAKTLPGLLIMSIPIGLLYLHLELRHAYAPHAVGDRVLLGLQLTDPKDGPTVRLDAVTAGLEPDIGPVLAEREGRVYYRLRVTAVGDHVIRIAVGDETFDKHVVATEEGAISVERASGIGNAWAMSNEPALDPDGRVQRIWVEHQARDDTWLSMPWWLIWLGGSGVAAMLLRRPMRAEI